MHEHTSVPFPRVTSRGAFTLEPQSKQITNNSNRDAAHRTRMKTDQSQHDANGKLKNGVFKEYFKDGMLACVGKYRNGEKIGEWKYYLRNGLLKAIGRFSNGKMTGEWKWYRENGKLMQTGSFDDEKKAGVWKRYHPTGALYDEGEYANDNKVGEWRTYDTKGKLTKSTRHKR